MPKRLSSLGFIKILSVAVVFCPQFISSVGLKLEQLFSVLILLVLLFYFFKRQLINVNAFYFALIYLLLLSIDAVRSIGTFIIRDSFEFIKPLLFLLFFSLGYSFKGDEKKFYSYLVFFNKLFIVVSVLGIAEATIPFINTLFTLIYKENEPVLRNKAILSFINPYYFAALLLLPVFYNLILFWGSKKQRFLFSFIICFSCMIFTQSKTTLLGFIFTFVIYIFIVILHKWIPGRRVIVFMAVFFIFAVIIVLPIIISFAEKNLRYMYNGLSAFLGSLSSYDFQIIINSSNSTRLRYEQFRYVLQNQDVFPVIGVGIGKGEVILESFYAMYLYRTGLVGIVMHFLLLCFIGKKAFSLARLKTLHNNANLVRLISFYIAFPIFLISLFFSYFSSAVTDQTRVAFFFYLFLGYVYSVKDYMKNS